MSLFIKTDTILDKILEQKQVEVAEAGHKAGSVQRSAHTALAPRDFAGALRKDTVALIAEVKKASPSKGVLVENFDHLMIGKIYAENGAAAISVLTDEQFFQGKLEYMTEVRAATNIPVLRKDFVIDPFQVYEARAAQADAVLLIVMALEDMQLKDLHNLIRELGMSALVEVHNEAELERALKIDAKLIGVNNRDLRTFHEDLNTTARVAELVPDDVTLVAESAIRSSADVLKMGELGAHAVLVGEGLVKADNIAQQVRNFSSQSRPKTRLS